MGKRRELDLPDWFPEDGHRRPPEPEQLFRKMTREDYLEFPDPKLATALRTAGYLMSAKWDERIEEKMRRLGFDLHGVCDGRIAFDTWDERSRFEDFIEGWRLGEGPPWLLQHAFTPDLIVPTKQLASLHDFLKWEGRRGRRRH